MRAFERFCRKRLKRYAQSSGDIIPILQVLMFSGSKADRAIAFITSSDCRRLIHNSGYGLVEHSYSAPSVTHKKFSCQTTANRKNPNLRELFVI